jgi:hypothetical protein
LAVNTLNGDDIVFCDAVLFAAGANYCIHGSNP